MAYDEALAQRIRSILGDRDDVREQKMFGGLTFMVGGHMTVGVIHDDLMVRIGSAGFDDAISRPHARPMDFTGRPLRGYALRRSVRHGHRSRSARLGPPHARRRRHAAAAGSAAGDDSRPPARDGGDASHGRRRDGPGRAARPRRARAAAQRCAGAESGLARELVQQARAPPPRRPSGCTNGGTCAAAHHRRGGRGATRRRSGGHVRRRPAGRPRLG